MTENQAKELIEQAHQTNYLLEQILNNVKWIHESQLAIANRLAEPLEKLGRTIG